MWPLHLQVRPPHLSDTIRERRDLGSDRTRKMGGPVYIIYRQEYSQLAQKLHGNPIVWPVVAKIRQSPPRDEVSFRVWLWNLVKQHGPGTYRIVRTHSEGERRGFHPVFYGYVGEDFISLERRYTQFKSHPGLPLSRQLYYKPSKRRVRFRRKTPRSHLGFHRPIENMSTV